VLLGAFSLGNGIPFISTIASAQGCGAIVFSIIDTNPKIDAYSNDGIIPDKLTGHIQFRNVGFRYPSRKTVPVYLANRVKNGKNKVILFLRF
jgi:ATP-binding cassette subfamily B (MDR/TAP) protein 1